MKKSLVVLCFMLSILLGCFSVSAVQDDACQTETSYHTSGTKASFSLSMKNPVAGALISVACYEDGKLVYIDTVTATGDETMTFSVDDNISFDFVKAFCFEGSVTLAPKGEKEELNVARIVVDDINKTGGKTEITGETVTYEYTNANNKTKSMTFANASDTNLYYNNVKVGNLKEATAAEMFKNLSDYQNVTFNGKNGLTNEIHITEYVYGFIEQIEGEYIETDTNEYDFSADAHIEGFTCNIYKNGEAITFDQLAEGDFINMVIGDLEGDFYNASTATIYVSSDAMEGQLSKLETNDNGEQVYVIGGVKYGIMNHIVADQIKPGDKAMFYTTPDGKIYDVVPFSLTFSPTQNSILTADILNEKVVLKCWLSDTTSILSALPFARASETSLYLNGLKIGTLDNVDAANYFYCLSDANDYSSVTFKSTKSENKQVYNEIHITMYEHCMVEDIIPEEQTVITDCGLYIFDAESHVEGFTYKIYKGGKEIALTDLQPTDVLSICSCGETFDDASSATVYVTNNTVEGIITEYNPPRDTYKINNKTYSLAFGANIIGLNPGDTGTFFLTVDGFIYDAILSRTTKYGFVLNMGLSTQAFSTVWQIELLTEDDEVVVYNVNDRVKIEGSTCKNDYCNGNTNCSCNQCAALAGLYQAVYAPSSQNASSRLIAYKLNEEDNIITIDYATLNGSAREFNYQPLTENTSYNAATSQLGSYGVNEKTVIFNIPIDSDGYIDEQNSHVYQLDSLKENVTNYTGYVYDVSLNQVIGAALITTPDVFEYIPKEEPTVPDAEIINGQGFVLNMALSSHAFGQNWEIKMLNEEDEVVTYTVKDNVKINGIVSKNDACSGMNYCSCAQCAALVDLYDAVQSPNPDTAAVRLIQYTAVNNEISNIDFASAFNGSNVTEYNYNTLSYARYNPNTFRLGSYNLLEETVLFNAPFEMDYDNNFILDENKVHVYAVDALDEDIWEYTGFVYNINADREIYSALITNSIGFSGKKAPLAVVKSISTGLDANGNPADIVTFFQAGETKSLAVTNDAYLNASYDASDMTMGDIFQYTTSKKGEINNMVEIYDAEDGYYNNPLYGGVLASENNVGTVTYHVGVVTGISNRYVDLADGTSFGWTLNENGTNLLIDTETAKLDINRAFNGKTDVSHLKEARTVGENYTSDVYVMVVKADDGCVTECVAYLYPKDETRNVENFNALFVSN